MGKSSGGGGVQESVVTQTNLPEYAQPFYEELLGRTVYESTRPYETFPGQRLAEFSPFEQAGMQGMAEIAQAGTPQQIRSASDIATGVGFQGVGAGMDVARGFRPPMQFSEYQAGDIGTGYDAGFLGQGFQAGQRDVGYQAGAFDPMYQARERQSGFDVGPLESGYQAGRFDPLYQARDIQSQYTGQVDLGPGFQAGTIADPATLESYMNPYQQLVTDIEKREAQRQSDIQAAEISQTAAQAGGLGGYREAIMQAERERNLGQQLADIQTRGSQAAFEQAQQAFEADRAARLQEAQFGLTASEQRERAAQQAEQFRQQAFQTGEQARQRAAEMGMTAQQQEDAARQAQEQFRQAAFGQTADVAAQREQFQQQAFQAGEQARQRAAEMGMTAQQQEDAARQAQERFQQDAFAQNQQLRLAQQQEDRAVFQAREAARQEAARLGLSAQELQERVNQAENEARMRARQEQAQLEETRARLGLAGLEADRATRGQQLDAARLLGQLGTDEQRMAFDRLRNLQAAGQIQRELQQRGLDLGYQDFLRQQAFPREQLAFFSQLLQGLPVTPGTTTATFGGPSETQQLLGAGIGGVGLYNALRGG
jgi:hypothetical protein|tara:strand:+ start:5813 stop:7603 length:1791 start_codon:yes stop_codon:yes gene_type:complete